MPTTGGRSIVADLNSVYVTDDAGSNRWTNITGNLVVVRPGTTAVAWSFIPGLPTECDRRRREPRRVLHDDRQSGDVDAAGRRTCPTLPFTTWTTTWRTIFFRSVCWDVAPGRWATSRSDLTDADRLSSVVANRVQGLESSTISTPMVTATPNEGGLSGIRVFVDSIPNGILDPQELSTLTAADGSYTLQSAGRS